MGIEVGDREAASGTTGQPPQALPVAGLVPAGTDVNDHAEKPAWQIVAEANAQRLTYWRHLSKLEWIASARSEANFGEPECCEICGFSSLISHAHHWIPLGDQFDRGFITPSQRHSWLCPNHHAMVHIFLRFRGEFPESDPNAKRNFGLTDDQIAKFADLVRNARERNRLDGSRFKKVGP